MAHHHHNGPGPEALPSRFVPVASPGALMGVDWESRVDFERLRRYRMGRVKEKLNESSLGSLLLFDMNNIRYTTAGHIGNWARDKLFRCVLITRDADPILWDIGSSAKQHQLHNPWLPVESWQRRPLELARLDPRGGRGREGQRPADRRHPARARPGQRSRRRRLHRDPRAQGARGRGARDPERPGADAGRPQAQVAGRGGAARDRRGDGRRGLRRAVPRDDGRGEGERDGGGRQPRALQPRLGGGRVRQRHLRRALQPASARLLGPDHAAGRHGLLRHHPLLHGLPDVLLPDAERRRRDREAARRVRARPLLHGRRDRGDPARRQLGGRRPALPGGRGLRLRHRGGGVRPPVLPRRRPLACGSSR